MGFTVKFGLVASLLALLLSGCRSHTSQNIQQSSLSSLSLGLPEGSGSIYNAADIRLTSMQSTCADRNFEKYIPDVTKQDYVFSDYSVLNDCDYELILKLYKVAPGTTVKPLKSTYANTDPPCNITFIDKDDLKSGKYKDKPVEVSVCKSKDAPLELPDSLDSVDPRSRGGQGPQGGGGSNGGVNDPVESGSSDLNVEVEFEDGTGATPGTPGASAGTPQTNPPSGQTENRNQNTSSAPGELIGKYTSKCAPVFGSQAQFHVVNIEIGPQTIKIQRLVTSDRSCQDPQQQTLEERGSAAYSLQGANNQSAQIDLLINEHAYLLKSEVAAYDWNRRRACGLSDWQAGNWRETIKAGTSAAACLKDLGGVVRSYDLVRWSNNKLTFGQKSILDENKHPVIYGLTSSTRPTAFMKLELEKANGQPPAEDTTKPPPSAVTLDFVKIKPLAEKYCARCHFHENAVQIEFWTDDNFEFSREEIVTAIRDKNMPKMRALSAEDRKEVEFIDVPKADGLTDRQLLLKWLSQQD